MLRATPSLRTRLFLGTTLVIAAVLGGVLAVSWLSTARESREATRRAVTATRDQVRALLAAEYAQLAARAEVFANDPVKSADIFGAGPDALASALDRAVVAAEETQATWAQLVNAEGTRLAKSDEPAAPAADLRRSSLVSRALAGETATGYGVAGTVLFAAVAVPVAERVEGQGRVRGVLMVARTLGDSIAARLAAATATESALFALDSADAPVLVGASPGITDRAALATYVKAHPQLLFGSMKTDSATVRDGGMRTTLAGRDYALAGDPLLSAGGNAIGGIVMLHAGASPLAGLRRALLLSAALGLALAFLLAAALARNVAAPVRALEGATRRASEGDYAAEIPAGGPREIASLADAVRRLLADLREKSALAELLGGDAGGTGGRTMPMNLSPAARATGAPRTGTGLLEPGTTLGGRYEIRAALGSGGMGAVHRALDRELGETVALKTLRGDFVAADASALERFKEEIRLARRISHRNVVRTHDLGESDGVYYITMELVEGSPLSELLERGALPLDATLSIAKQLCRALEVAHEAGVIHRDIKPQNVLVQPDGVVKVMDFGIARLASRREGLTQTGMVIGTPEYMAPEQLAGGELDPRADVYAAGVVLYQSATGTLPHDADSMVTLMHAVLFGAPPRDPRTIRPEIPAPMAEVMLRAIARDRDARWPSAAAMLAALEALGAAPPSPRMSQPALPARSA